MKRRNMCVSDVATLGVLALLMGGGGVAHGNEYGFYANEDDQRWGLTQMPDFDQKRAAIFAIPGLPNDGAMYCVPTSTMNAFAYIARRGYPAIPPGIGDWDGGDADDYAYVTNLLENLGVLMGTSGTGGTSAQGWYDGTRTWLPEAQFDVYQRLALSNHDTTTREIANIGRTGGLTMFCYGRWEHNGFTLTDRTGGHCVTPTEVNVDVPVLSELRYRNPSTSDSEFFQSAFSSTDLDVTDVTYTFEGDNYTFSRMEFDITDPEDNRVRLIDFLGVIFPKNGLTNWPGGNVTNIAPNPVDPGNPITTTFAAPAPVIICELAPARTYAAMTTFNPLLELNSIYRMRSSNGALTYVGPCDASTRMTFCRRGYLNVVQGRELIQYDLDDVPTEVGRVVMPAGITAADMCYDDANDQIVILSDDEEIRYGFDLSGPPEIRPLPTGEFNSQFISVSPLDGTTFVGSNGHYTQMSWDNVQNVPLSTHTLPAGDSMSDLSVDDQGHVFTSINGVGGEFNRDRSGNWVPATGSLFSGQPVGSSFQVSRSRTNYDARVHGVAGWNTNILPADLVLAGETVDCAADFNGDGVGDITDLLGFLVAWFGGDPIADLDANTVVDVLDLLEFIASWFEGC